MGNNPPKGQIGREVQKTDVLFNLDVEIINATMTSILGSNKEFERDK